MTKNQTIKYIDLIFKEIMDFNLVSIKNPIFNKLKPETKKEKDLYFKILEEVTVFGKNNDLFEPAGTGDFFKLLEKGKALKQSNKGFKKFSNQFNKTKWYNENWIGYTIALIVLIFSVYQHFEKRSLTHQVDSLKKQRDSLNNQVRLYKTAQYELKQKIEKQKELEK